MKTDPITFIALLICVNASAQPANDLCSGAVPQSLSIGSTLTFSGDCTGATNTEGLAYNTVWEAFTLTECADVSYTLCGTTPVMQYIPAVLYSACPVAANGIVYPGSYDNTTCGDGNTTVHHARLPAGTFYLPLASDWGSTYQLHIAASACGSHALANDDCSGAIALPVGQWCAPLTIATPWATQSLPADCGLGAIANDDAWYSFVADQATMTIGVSPNGYYFDAVIELYVGPCDTLHPYACADVTSLQEDEVLIATDLSIGETYLFRVYNYVWQTPLDDPSYGVCVVSGESPSIGIIEPDRPATPMLFPNPTDGDFTVQVDPRRTSVSVTIIDATGRTVFGRTERNKAGTVQVLVAGILSPGLYIVRVDDGSHTGEARLMIQ